MMVTACSQKALVIYSRVSSKEREKEGFSIPAQLEYSLQKPFDTFVNMPTCVDWLPKLEVIRTEHYQEIIEMSHLLAGMQRYFPSLAAMQHH